MKFFMIMNISITIRHRTKINIFLLSNNFSFPNLGIKATTNILAYITLWLDISKQMDCICFRSYPKLFNRNTTNQPGQPQKWRACGTDIYIDNAY